MDTEDFEKSLTAAQPPAGLSVYRQALWHDAKGDWQRAHELIQDLPDRHAAWVHAYLHRKEGDTWNADYWYRKAGKTRPASALHQEWQQLVTALA